MSDDDWGYDDDDNDDYGGGGYKSSGGGGGGGGAGMLIFGIGALVGFLVTKLFSDRNRRNRGNPSYGQSHSSSGRGFGSSAPPWNARPGPSSSQRQTPLFSGARGEAARREATRSEATRSESSLSSSVAGMLEVLNSEAARIEAARIEAARIEAARREAARREVAVAAARIEEEHIKRRVAGRKLETELNQVPDEVKCIVCYSNEREVVLLPCRHFCICVDCCRRVRKCPYCNAGITGQTVTYLP